MLNIKLCVYIYLSYDLKKKMYLHSEKFCLWPCDQGKGEVWFLLLKVTKEFRCIVKSF